MIKRELSRAVDHLIQRPLERGGVLISNFYCGY